jgi:phosphoribosylanthranilate isomerase
VRVKICGITNLDDALHAAACGADALGFVFYEKSPRYVTPETAKKIIAALPPFVERVGLFVNATSEYMESIARMCGISTIQPHFHIDESLLQAFSLPVLPVVRAASQEDVKRFESHYRLVDAYCEAYGGSGKRLNLEWFEHIDCSRIVIAGGLTPDNLDEVRGYGFYGVDVSSGVEASKGKKDPAKVEAFIRHAKAL